jgi:hypothetical protein
LFFIRFCALLAFS